MLQTLQTEGTSTPMWPSLSFSHLRQEVTEHQPADGKQNEALDFSLYAKHIQGYLFPFPFG